MKKFYKNFLLIFLILFSLEAFAEDWYICLESYKVEKNVAEAIQEFEDHGCKVFAGKFETDEGTFYRILLDKKFASHDIATIYRKFLEESPDYEFLRSKGIWCVEYSGESYKPEALDAKSSPSKQTATENIENSEYAAIKLSSEKQKEKIVREAPPPPTKL